MNSTLRRTRVRLLADVSGAVALSVLAGGGLLAIRPAGISLLRSDAGAPHLTGTVADVAFRGRGYEYAIHLPGLPHPGAHGVRGPMIAKTFPFT